MRYKVFISSTFADLQEYREALREAISKAGFEPLMMENYAASAYTPLETAEKDIRNCDIFILIVGNRYGGIPTSSTKSYIQIETELAIELKKPILVFIYDDGLKSKEKATENDVRLNEFKEFLLRDYLVQFFATQSELIIHTYQSLARIRMRLQQRDEILERQVREVNEVAEEKTIYKTNKRPVSKNKLPSKSTDSKDLVIIRLLLSSPGDVPEERERLTKAVFKFNNQFTEEKRVFFKVIRWEDMAPQIGKSPQFTINNQIGFYDIFVGIMWNRFGTPTDIAASGTEEEFNTALQNWQNTKKPWITFYFSLRAKNLSTSGELQQKQKVIDFKDKITKLGIYKDYKTLTKFEDIIYDDLVRIVKAPNFHKRVKL